MRCAVSRTRYLRGSQTDRSTSETIGESSTSRQVMRNKYLYLPSTCRERAGVRAVGTFRDCKSSIRASVSLSTPASARYLALWVGHSPQSSKASILIGMVRWSQVGNHLLDLSSAPR